MVLPSHVLLLATVAFAIASCEGGSSDATDPLSPTAFATPTSATSRCLDAIARLGAEPLPRECFDEWGLPEPAPLPEGWEPFGRGIPGGSRIVVEGGTEFSLPLADLSSYFPLTAEATPLADRTPVIAPCEDLITSIRWTISPATAAELVAFDTIVEGERTPSGMGQTPVGDGVAPVCATLVIRNGGTGPASVELTLFPGKAKGS